MSHPDSSPSAVDPAAAPLWMRMRIGIVFLPHLMLLAIWDLGSAIAPTLAVMGAAVAVLAWARRWRPVPSLHVILLVAAGLRLLVLPLPPSLSDDVFRYVWDGRVASAGFNPYELAPDAVELAGLRDELWQALPHRDVATVYPPLALGAFSIAARLPNPVLAWKLLLLLVDLVTCFFLVKLAALLTSDPGRALWYAWNPLVTVEIAGMGHVDGLGVCALVVAVWALVAKRSATMVAIAAAAGALAKLVPLVAYPIWMRRSPSPMRFLAVSALALGAALGPVVAASGGVPAGYARFGGSWEFNGPLYEPLRRSFDAIDSRSHLEGALDRVKAATGRHELLNRWYPHNHSRMHARLLLAGLLLLLLIRSWRRRDVVAATGAALEALVLCSATVYPWYLIWLLPIAALTTRMSWLVLCTAAALSYAAQFGGIELFPWVFLACWAPYGIVRILERRWSRT